MLAFVRGLAAVAFGYVAAASVGMPCRRMPPSRSRRVGETITGLISIRPSCCRLPDGTATLVVGNPLIADVAVQSGGTMVVTGKSYGNTNLVALDRNGVVMMEHQIEVSGPEGQPRRGVPRHRARDLQLHAGLRAAHHAGRHAELLRGDTWPDRRR